MVDVEAGLDLLLLPGGGGDGPVDVADGDGEPVHAGFPDEPRGLVRVREAPARGEKLLVGGQRAGLVAQHGAELAFDRDARGMGQLDDLPGAGDVPLQRQARAVDHHRVIAGGDRAVDDVLEVDALVVLVDDRDVVEVQPGERGSLTRSYSSRTASRLPASNFTHSRRATMMRPKLSVSRRARTTGSIIGR